MKQWKLIDEDNASVIDAQNNVRKLYLGELFFGQRMVRKFSVMNMGSSELRIELSRNASVNKEVRRYIGIWCFKLFFIVDMFIIDSPFIFG